MKIILKKHMTDLILEAIDKAKNEGNEIEMIKLNREEWERLNRESAAYMFRTNPAEAFKFNEYNTIPKQCMTVFGVLVIPEEEIDD